MRNLMLFEAAAFTTPATAQTPNRQRLERIVAQRHDATVQAPRDLGDQDQVDRQRYRA